VIVVVAEKPSVAREIAGVVGATTRKTGYLEGGGYQVTWALGHLVRLSEPAEMRAEWGYPWRADVLPMLPTEWPLQVIDRSKDQYRVVSQLLCGRAVREVVCATDAGREGELIFRLIYDRSGCTRPVRRLWIASLTSQAIADGLRSLKPAAAYDALATAARARSMADWLVGMNLSRAYQMGRGKATSVGRVQTPTLAFIVKRDKEIADFVPKKFRQVKADFTTAAGATFEAMYVRAVDGTDGAPKQSSFLPMPRPGLAPEHDADAVASRARSGQATILRVDGVTAAEQPPQLFDLTTLQRTANRLWGWTAAGTLQVAQSLYEAKLLSYPRTDSRYLSSDVALTLPRVVSGIAGFYPGLVAPGTGQTSLGKRFVNDAKVSDHHAIIPTGTEPRSLETGTDAALLYDLVCRRLLQAWHEDLQLRRTEVLVQVSEGQALDRYLARGTTTVRAGWKALEVRAKEASGEVELPPGLVAGLKLDVADVRIREDKTRPSPHYTESELLRTLETAGCGLSDELAEAMKDKGLGTPATRAAIIETLLARNYIVRSGKSLRATPAGSELIDAVDIHVCSAALTAEMEEKLRRIERGEQSAHVFMEELEKFVKTRVQEALKNGVAKRLPTPARASAGAPGAGRGSSKKRAKAKPRATFVIGKVRS
jgi:DNA topoisomerase-3